MFDWLKKLVGGNRTSFAGGSHPATAGDSLAALLAGQRGPGGAANFAAMLNNMGEGGGSKLAELFNHTNKTGAANYGSFLNQATAEENQEFRKWLELAPPDEIRQAADFLNRARSSEAGQLLSFVRGIGGNSKRQPAVASPRAAETGAAGAPAGATATAQTVAAASDVVRFRCTACGKLLKVPISAVGRRAKCPKCGAAMRVSAPAPVERAAEEAFQGGVPAKAGGQPANRASPRASTAAADWGHLYTYLRERNPADIDAIKDETVFANVVKYYEAVVSDLTAPRLSYYVLKASSRSEAFPFLVVATGDRSEHDKAWNFNYEPILQRALPGQGWSAVRRDGHANFSKPGCNLASTAPFDRLADAILQGAYQLDRVLRLTDQTQDGAAAEQAQQKAPRWDVLVFGDEVVIPELACHFCGENRVALGFQGTHIRCLRCGSIYCRRNCQASIHGQCPKCGEADQVERIESVPEPVSKVSTPAPEAQLQVGARFCRQCEAGLNWWSLKMLGGAMSRPGVHTFGTFGGAGSRPASFAGVCSSCQDGFCKDHARQGNCPKCGNRLTE